METLESILGAVSLFAELRPDEIGRIARWFERRRLLNGDTYAFPNESGTPQMFVVIAGHIEAIVADPVGELRIRMRPGDRYGEAMALSGRQHATRLLSLTDGEVAVLDRCGLDRILEEYPAVALRLVADLATELRWRNDQVRQVLELRRAGLPLAQVHRAMAQLRRTLLLRSAGLRRLTTAGQFRRLVAERGAEPPFFMLVGFALGMVGSRITVYIILKYHLEKHLFALVAGSDPNPMHIHHFNYGLVLIGLTGLVSLLPRGRDSLRTLALLFGLGCALVFDEFALFWNLDPDYTQGLSLITSAMAASVLIQIAYFRRFWLALFVRLAAWVGGD